ncbi:hypothetical protein NKH09_30535, partial [Mesorhizobium sp. M1339]|uniref:hypothetical protein n=1 Tax=Mesorhizobium sp. M1339 TaxID=2957086 RepID=UPI0033352028
MDGTPHVTCDSHTMAPRCRSGGRPSHQVTATEAPGGADMTAPAGCQLIGRWRIIEADLWDRGYPAMITIGGDNNGEIAFGALQAGLDLSCSPSIVDFTWGGWVEIDEVTGDGHAELLDDSSIEITFAYHNGDQGILKAKRDPSSTDGVIGVSAEPN